jgi:PPOX class probable F420-dependent enzyme
MRRHLDVDQLGDLLERPTVAVLATYRHDGSVLLSPVWHEWRDGGFNVVTSADDVKTRHLRRDPRANIVVYEQRPPFRGVEVRGRARLEPAEAPAAARRIAVRYLGEASAAQYVEAVVDDMLIRLEPGAIRAWDFADEYG